MVHNGEGMSAIEQRAEPRELSLSLDVAASSESAGAQPEIRTLDDLAANQCDESANVDPAYIALTGAKAFLRRFEKATFAIGMLFLIAGLAVWRFKPHSNDRLALILLVCAMFLAILHHYSIEENVYRNGKNTGQP